MLWLIALTILAFYFAVFYRSQTFTETNYESGKTPPIFSILLKIFVRVLRRRQGRIYCAAHQNEETRHGGKETKKEGDKEAEVEHIPPSDDEIIVINNYRVTKELLEQYKTVCGDKSNGVNETVPLCFPECLFVYNLLLLVCKPSFKLSPFGLIHLGQTIKQHEDLQQLLDAPCSLETQTKDYRRVPRGVEVDISVRVIAASGKCVWSGVATLLSRSKQAQSSGGAASVSRQQTNDPAWENEDRCTRQEIKVAGDTGVKYAGVSGDWNPHHLYPWSARLLGYRAPIAHGLWTMAKAVALISESAENTSKFTELEGKFKRPLFLPGTAILEHYTEGSAIKFRVIDSKTQAPHLVGSLS
ncbi:3-hydroxyacyl-thioester dehydratase X-like [Littorina saxatilis]|uniref:MaoC-like domain-containing protein n=1 Tax=Littorina saxatilis TaxID=31220 RepID=A0AAN9B8H6_9CAEN